MNVKLLLSSLNTYASGQESGRFIGLDDKLDSRNFRLFLFVIICLFSEIVSDICDRTDIFEF